MVLFHYCTSADTAGVPIRAAEQISTTTAEEEEPRG